MNYYDENRKVCEIDENNLVGIRDFGKVYKLSENTAAKILHPNSSTNITENKLKAMISSAAGKNTEFLEWPKEILYSEGGKFSGYIMPYITGKTLRKAPINQNMSWETKVVLARNLSVAVKNAHDMGHVVGNLNIKRAKYDENGNLILTHCDSFQLNDPKYKTNYYPCFFYNSAIKYYAAPEIQGKINYIDFLENHFTKESDYFALAVTIYELLSEYSHPFRFCYNGVKTSSEYILSNIVDDRCTLFPEAYNDNLIEEPEEFQQTLNKVFSPEICNLFKKTFLDGHKDPSMRATAEDWYMALSDFLQNLKQCDLNPIHHYYKDLDKCPLCLNEEKKSVYEAKRKNEEIKNSVKHYVTKDNNAYEIDEENENNRLAYSMDNYIYRISDDLVAKIRRRIVRTPYTESMKRLIQDMIDSSVGKNTQFLAWPKEVLIEEKNRFAGYTMPYFDGNPLSSAYLDQNLSWKNRVILAKDLAAAVKNVHDMDHFVCHIDNSAKYDTDGKLTLIKCEYYQITVPNDKNHFYYSRCGGSADYIAPELQEYYGFYSYTKEEDYFALAVIIFQLLSYGIHPFAVHYIGKESENEYTIVNNIISGRCILFPETCKGHPIEKTAEYLFDLDKTLPPDICDLFKRTFVYGHKDPKMRATAEEWHNALSELLLNLKQCERNPMHYYHKDLEKCPWCLNEEIISVDKT